MDANNKYLTFKQIDGIAPDFSDTMEFLKDLVEEIIEIRDQLLMGTGTDKDIKKRVIKQLKEVEKNIKNSIDKTLEREQGVIDEIEHTAICNEIYNNLEVGRLMKRFEK